MTLIVGHDKDNFPVLFGDLLVSSPRELKVREIDIPGFAKPFDVREGMFEWLAPVGLLQKSILISPSLAFVWAGPPLVAAQFIKELTSRITDTSEFSREQWIEFMQPAWDMLVEEKRTVYGAEFSCIALLCSTQYQSFIPFGVQPSEAEGCNFICADGSGKNWALNSILDIDNAAIPDHKRVANPVESIVCMMAKLWARDSTDQLNYVDGVFGGGYEAVVLGQNGLEKLDDFILANAQLIQTSINGFEMRISLTIAKFDYIAEALVMRVRQMKRDLGITNPNAQIADAVQENYLVGRPGESLPTTLINDSHLPDLNATWLGFHADCFLINGTVTGFQVAYSSLDRKLPIMFNGSTFSISPSFQEELHEMFKVISDRG